MTQSLSLRKKNWPVYKDYLDFTYHGLTELRAAFKSYYFDDQGADLSVMDRYYVEKLMLAPDISDELIDSVKMAFSMKTQMDKLNFVRDILRFQKQEGYGFGSNSFFQYQEERIIDQLGFYDIDWVEHFTELYSSRPLRGLHEYLTVPIHYRDYIESTSIQANNQNWRSANAWAAKIQSIPANAVVLKRNIHTERHILGMEAICRYPDRFDPKLVEAAHIVQPVFSSRNTPDHVVDFIQELLDSQFEGYINEQCVAGKVHVCVKYENVDQMNAMQNILNPVTRPLSNLNQLTGRLYEKIYRGSSIRVTEKILHSLLETGMVFDDIRVVEEASLLCTRYMGIILSKSVKGMSGLSFDATDFDNRYKAKNTAGWETCISRVKPLPAAFVVECVDGSWKVGHPSNTHAKHVDSNKKLAKIANSASSAEELAIELSHPANQRLLIP